MSAHWQSGDRAICVITKPWRDGMGMETLGGPVKDTVYLVTAVVPFGAYIGLGIAGFEGRLWDADEFRRVVPMTDRWDCGQEVSVPVAQPVEVQIPMETRP